MNSTILPVLYTKTQYRVRPVQPDDSSGLGRLFRVETLNRTRPDKFEAIIHSHSAVGTWMTNISEETNAGMLKFPLTKQNNK